MKPKYWRTIPMLAAFLVADLGQVRAASFDCAQAHTPIEDTICSSERLSWLDDQLGSEFRRYQRMGAEVPGTRLQDQRDWLKRRLSICSLPATCVLDENTRRAAAACLIPVYHQRLAELNSPGLSIKRTAPRVSDSPADRQACEELADRIRTFVPPRDKPSPGAISPLFSQGGDLVRRPDAVSDQTRDRLHSSLIRSSVFDDDESAFDETADWTSMGNPPLVVSESVGGTARCQRFAFYSVPTKGAVKIVPAPEPTDESSYCSGNNVGAYATLAEIKGQPTFIVNEFSSVNENLRFFARDRDSWRRICALAVSWKAVFTHTADQCDGAVCRQLAEKAVEIAASYDANADVSKFWKDVPTIPTPESHKRRFAAYFGARLSDDPNATSDHDAVNDALSGAQYWTIKFGDQPLTVFRPSLGAHPDYYAVFPVKETGKLRMVSLSPNPNDDKTGVLSELPVSDSNGYYTAFNSYSAIVPLQVGDATYLVRVGHGQRGWHTSDDYFLAVFGPGRDTFEPLAGTMVAKGRGPTPQVDIQ